MTNDTTTPGAGEELKPLVQAFFDRWNLTGVTGKDADNLRARLAHAENFNIFPGENWSMMTPGERVTALLTMIDAPSTPVCFYDSHTVEARLLSLAATARDSGSRGVHIQHGDQLADDIEAALGTPRAAASVTTASSDEEVAATVSPPIREAKNPVPTRPVAGEGETEPVAWRARFRSEWAVNSWSYVEGETRPALEPWDGVRGHEFEPLYAQPAEAWKPIGEDTPRDGTEIVGYRPDQGVFVFRWMTMGELVPKDANGDPAEDYDDTFAWWFHDRWGWMEGELTPTQWMNMPAQPALPTPAKGGE